LDSHPQAAIITPVIASQIRIWSQLRIWLIGVLIVSTIGIGALFFLGFKYFTHQGNDLDWIYEVGGLFAILWLLSALGAVLFSAVIAIANKGKKAEPLP
jgi:hypothetical protein